MKLDDQLKVLSSSDRRQLLHTLTEDAAHTTPVDSPHNMETNGGNRDQAVVMHHVHLPRLEDHSLITWKEETGEITRGPQFDEIEPLLEAFTENLNPQAAGEPPD
jgi:hypothetical protein